MQEQKVIYLFVHVRVHARVTELGAQFNPNEFSVFFSLPRGPSPF